MDTHVTATNLTRLLSRLDSKLTTTTASTPPTSLERTKIASNLEYARQLLLTLEKSAPTIRNHSQRQTLLTKLGEQKALIRRLNETVQLLAHDAPSSDADSDSGADSDAEDDEPPVYTEQSPALHDATEKEGLRNRFPSQKDQRATLFNGASEEEADPEKALDLHRAEQEALTTDMLTLAQQLKANSIRFGQELQKEKGLLDLAAEGLDKNVLGIEGTGRKMNSLRRDENVGWLWGILYPVIIAALMFLVLIVLLVAPKLRWW
ncbi:uncharacterized protein LAJ45_05754 [Morchella importuna]|uniref:uncharacterized protein n=1 Tax=Morchella importuna TaxID=1174673 RepID=UPI001E8D008C|nr:uncharacterized protein LAJ45_05754 [Morchella importuna]KAH8150068.1 hypothetical protein LAJ45_05754 [Morchella importuna]